MHGAALHDARPLHTLQRLGTVRYGYGYDVIYITLALVLTAAPTQNGKICNQYLLTRTYMCCRYLPYSILNPDRSIHPSIVPPPRPPA